MKSLLLRTVVLGKRTAANSFKNGQSGCTQNDRTIVVVGLLLSSAAPYFVTLQVNSERKKQNFNHLCTLLDWSETELRKNYYFIFLSFISLISETTMYII